MAKLSLYLLGVTVNRQSCNPAVSLPIEKQIDVNSTILFVFFFIHQRSQVNPYVAVYLVV